MCKKLICLISLVSVLGLANIASADLVAHWKLDEGSGTIASDSSGNRHDGTLEGNTQWVAGVLDGGLQFAGVPDRVVVPYSAQLNPTDAFTVSLWTNVAPGSSGYRSPITSRDERLTGGGQSGYIIYAGSNNNWQFWIGTGTGWSTAAGTAVQNGEWTHVAVTYVPGDQKIYINGALAGQATGTMSANTQQYLAIGAGRTDYAQGDYFFVGKIDDVRVYNNVLSATEIGRLAARPKARTPSPANGAIVADTWVNLSWTAGAYAVSHDVYLSDSFDGVSAGVPEAFRGNQSSPAAVAGFVGFPYPDGLVPGTTYYWRIDEVNSTNPDSPWKGDVWSFSIPPRIAHNPKPADGSRYIALDAPLGWTGGLNAKLHTVYFGSGFADVNSATQGVLQTTNTFTPPGPLTKGTTYYWRVDEFDATATRKGNVWSFTTAPDIVVSDPNLLAWWTLDEGQGANVLDWSGHGHQGALAGDARWTDGYDLTGVQFDGAGDYVGFGTPADLHLPITYTYTAWFKPGRNIRGDSGQQYILCIGSRSDLVFGVEDSVGVNGDLSLHYYDTQPSFHAVGVGQTSWRADEWHMVAGTKDATGHKIYLDGKLKNSDGNTNQDNFNGAMTRMISLGAQAWNTARYFNGTIDDVRIYNKALTDQQIQQVMQGNALVAGNPQPARGAIVDFDTVRSLSWSAGGTAASHNVYFGTDRNAVANAGKSAPEYKGNQAGTSLSAAGLVEFGGGPYYWRIDEVEASGTVHGGTIWKFSIPNYLTVDDIESYNDLPETDPASNRIYKAWIDGYGTTTNGAVVGNLDVPLTERRTAYVHGGLQTMPLAYDNNRKFSEATRTFAVAQDWAREGVANLSLWFRGLGANATDRMYVVLNGTTVVYHDNPSATQTAPWTQWVIPLKTFAALGVNLTDVTSITIGLGTRGNTTVAGGTGQMYIDDIRLYRPTTP